MLYQFILDEFDAKGIDLVQCFELAVGIPPFLGSGQRTEELDFGFINRTIQLTRAIAIAIATVVIIVIIVIMVLMMMMVVVGRREKVRRGVMVVVGDGEGGW